MKRAVWAGVALVGLVIAVIVGGCPRQQATAPPTAQGPALETTAEEPAAHQRVTQEANCTVCGRPCPSNRLIEVQTAEGLLHFCCPVCLAAYIEQGKIDPATDNIMLHDLLTGEPISLKEVIVVVDSDVVCPAGRSVVALGSAENADKFIAEHGGTEKNWDDFLTTLTSAPQLSPLHSH